MIGIEIYAVDQTVATFSKACALVYGMVLRPKKGDRICPCTCTMQNARRISYDAIQIPIALSETRSQYTLFVARLPAHPDLRRLDFVGIRGYLGHRGG
jgi:hypothetical protein